VGIVALIFSIIGIATCDSKAPGIIGLIASIGAIVIALAIIIFIAALIGQASAV
jgi:hypothetical protein